MSSTQERLRDVLKKNMNNLVAPFGIAETSRVEQYIDQAEQQIIQLIETEQLELLDELTRRWNNYIGDMPDKEKQKLTYLEMTGLLWGIVAQLRIPLEQRTTLRGTE